MLRPAEAIDFEFEADVEGEPLAANNKRRMASIDMNGLPSAGILGLAARPGRR
jgi:hypothetical protein